MKPYYEADGITIYHGDCREILPDLDADVMVTDPPYGIELAGKSTKWTRRSGVGYVSEFTDTPEYVRRYVIPVIAASARRRRTVVTPGRKMMWAYPEPDSTGAIYYPSGAGMGPWGFVCWQPILYYGKCPYLAASAGSRPDSFSTTEAAAPNGHPVPKPIGSMRWIVNRASIPGESVVDPFMGSGTTLRAAKDLGRRAIGIELEERYCEIAVQRLAQMNLDLGDAA